MPDTPNIISLPAELLLDIAALLPDPIDLLHLSSTCPQFASVLRHPPAFHQNLRLYGFGIQHANTDSYEDIGPWLGLARTACDCHIVKTHLEDFTIFEDEFLEDDHPALIKIFLKLARLIKNPGMDETFLTRFASKIIEFASGIVFDSEPFYCYDRSFVLACCGYSITAGGGQITLQPAIWQRIFSLNRMWSHHHESPDVHLYTHFQLRYFQFLAALTRPTICAVLPRGFDRLKMSIGLASDPDKWRLNSRTAWTRLTNARIYGRYCYLPSDGTLAGITTNPNEDPMVMSMTTDSPVGTVTATGIDTYGSFSIAGTFTSDGLSFEKRYATYSFMYSGTFLPWGLVGEWGDPVPPQFVLGFFYMWKQDD